jgi:hypothetical protein
MGFYLMAYGAVFTARTAPGAAVSGGNRWTVAAWSLCGLAVAAVVSTVAVAIGTPEGG